MIITHLSKKFVEVRVDDFVEVDKSVKTTSNWLSDNFLLDLEGKWTYSFVALENKKIIGFIFCSLKNEMRLHVHRFVVSDKWQNANIGSKILKNLITYASKNNIKYISLKVQKINIGAINFYLKHGFKLIGTEDENEIYGRFI